MSKKSLHSHPVAKVTRKVIFIGIAALFVGALIFAFTQPMLAPSFEFKRNSEPENDPGKIFTEDQNGNVNPQVGENIKAQSYLIYDETTGKVLAARNPKTPTAIASITKLMTAYVTQQYGNLEDVWTITTESNINISPVLGLKVGDKVIVKDLVDAMLIGSANDAAATLGAYVSSVAKQPMIGLMNKESINLKMDSTHYENPIGFDSEQNYSSAADLKLLLDVVRPMPLFSKIDRKQSYSFTSELGNAYSVKATNSLLATDSEIHAIKTGYTDEAGGAMITAIYHDSYKFVMIVLGSTDREADTKLLKTQMLASLESITSR